MLQASNTDPPIYDKYSPQGTNMSSLPPDQLREHARQETLPSRNIIFFIPNNHRPGRNFDELTSASVLRGLGLLSITDLHNTPSSLNSKFPDFMQDRLAQWQSWPPFRPLNIRRRYVRMRRGRGTQIAPWRCWTCTHDRIADVLDAGALYAGPRPRDSP